ncbi:hypothetical protein GLOIN_2v1806038 [Rhizophagus clarus]|uniref:Uncharacterized protein n=1 Tax=Rhizophagus clarus TaxID=94130 RepID=A0A8H3MFX2_9GLOM|nr:hypothetical protein GLOIN_2v1806038 [Rhizophagus clarus]
MRYTINKLIDEVIDRANPNLTRIERRQFVLDNTKYLGNLITPKKVSDRLRFRDNQLQNAQNVQAAQAAQAARAVHAQTIQTVQTYSAVCTLLFTKYEKFLDDDNAD